MRNKTWLIMMMMVFFSTSLAWGGDLPWEMKLPFKQATIHYEITGTEKGKETLYIKESGKRQARHHQSTSTVMGMTTKKETIEITDPDWMYTYDLVEKKGGKTTNPNKIYLAEYNKMSGQEKKNFEKNAKELGTSMMGQFGGSVQQKGGKLLGYDCDITTVSGLSTIHMLHGSNVPLRTETSVMGMKTVLAATKIDTDAAIPDSAFAAPAGIEAVHNPEMESMMTSMIQHTVNTLKQPDGAKQMQQAGPMGMLGGADGAMPQGMPQGMQQHGMQKEMPAEGLSPADQQDLMRQMNEAMQQMHKMQEQKK